MDLVDPDILKQAQAIRRLDNWHGPLALAQDLATVVALLVAGIGFWVLAPAILVGLGAVQRALATIVHEAAHRNLAKSRFLNRLLGTVSAALIYQSLSAYRASHCVFHHGHFAELERDPDYAFMIAIGAYDAAGRAQARPRAALSLVWPYIKYLWKDRLMGDDKQLYSLERFIPPLFWLVLLTCTTLVFGVGPTLAIVVYWHLALLVTFPLIGLFIELSEHYPLMRPDGNVLTCTRNRYAGRLEATLTELHGEGYHLTHHLLPGIPFWQMQEATAILRTCPRFAEEDHKWGGFFSARTTGRSTVRGCTPWEQ